MYKTQDLSILEARLLFALRLIAGALCDGREEVRKLFLNFSVVFP